MEYGAVLVWWAAALALGLAGLPIAALVLDRLPDRGAGLSFPVAVVVLTLPVYWIGRVSFGPATVGLGVVALFGVAAVLARRVPPPDLRRFGEAAVAFSAAFFFLVTVRAADPSIYPYGGEKFLDYGLLNAVLRSSRLPPGDMWFAGEPVQYYYGGHLIAGIGTLLTGIAPPFSYNLALAWFYGMLVAAAYGVAGAIAAARGRSYGLAGAAAAVFVGFASNLVTPLQAVLWVLPARIALPTAEFVADRTDRGLDAGYLLSFRPESDAGLFYWAPSRVIEGTINEFPLFAFRNGDLHAHMMSTPFVLLVAGLAFAYYRTPASERRRRRAIVFGAIPPVAGLLGVVNTWSFPTAIGLAWLAVLFAPTAPEELLPGPVASRMPSETSWHRELSRIAAATTAAVGTLLLGVIWVLPFFAGPATGASGRSVGVVLDRSGFVEFFLVHGWILLVFGIYLGSRAVGRTEIDGPRAALLVGIAMTFGYFADAAAFALVLPIAALAWLFLRRGDANLGFESVLFVGGAGLVLLVEVIYLIEEAGAGRYNTVFKVYMDTWVIWATAAAVPFERAFSRRSSISRERLRRGVAVGCVLLLVAVSLYGAVALGEVYDSAGEPTLDATAWAKTSHAEEWEAIRWLHETAEGQPVMASAPGCWCNAEEGTRPYRWVNAPSSFTGVPTLAGWSHEQGYRGGDVYLDRVAEVEVLYGGSWERQRELLRRHDVEYVYVGPNERALYGDPGFDGRDALAVAFENREVTIYRVDRSRL